MLPAFLALCLNCQRYEVIYSNGAHNWEIGKNATQGEKRLFNLLSRMFDWTTKNRSILLDIRVFKILNKLKLLQGKTFEIVTRIQEKYGSRVRKLRKNYEALNYLKSLSKDLDVKCSEKAPVHAKLLVSNTCATVTSSNLILTSLMRNFELGAAYFHKRKIQQVEELFDNFWEDPALSNTQLNPTTSEWQII